MSPGKLPNPAKHITVEVLRIQINISYFIKIEGEEKQRETY